MTTRKVREKAPPKTKWEKSADRANQRIRAREPLFVHAGLTPLTTPEQRERAAERDRARFDAMLLEQRQRDEQTAASLGAEVERLATVEQWASFNARRPSYPTGARGDILLWDACLKELQHPRETPDTEQAHLAVEVRSERVAPKRTSQLSLFTPNPPPEAEQDDASPPPRPPCPDCGWQSASIFTSGNIHRANCPSLRAMILGMWERCTECAVERAAGGRACETHLARTRACDVEGHRPGPSTRPTESVVACQRCAIALDEPRAMA